MAGEQLGVFIRHLRRLVGPGAGGGLTDTQLLERWVAGRDEAAFEVMLWRHGPLVLGVCRRLLADPHDIDDAFQATFLTLVRRAAAIRRREALAGWLYQVAYRVALRARARRRRRADREEAGVELLGDEDKSDLVWRDLRPVLDEEIGRLPEKYRAAFVLCYLEGQTNAEAARALGCPVGTVLSRLAWARERLRRRLTRRGITVSGALLVTVLARDAVAAAAPAPLILTTLKAALAYAAGTGAVAAVSAPAVALTEGVVRAMMLDKLKIAAVVLGLALLGGTSAWAYLGAPGPAESPAPVPAGNTAAVAQGKDTGVVTTPETTPPPGSVTPTADDKAERRTVEVASPRDGIVKRVAIPLEEPASSPTAIVDFEGPVIKKGEKPPAGREIITERGGNWEMRLFVPKVGDKVEAGWTLVWLDDRLAQQEVAIRQAKVAAAEAELRAAQATRQEARVRAERAKQLLETKAISAEEYRAAQLTAERYDAEAVSKTQAVTVARGEHSQAETVWKMHRIRTPVGGVITRIYKHPGEAVKALEAVFQIRLAEPAK